MNKKKLLLLLFVQLLGNLNLYAKDESVTEPEYVIGLDTVGYYGVDAIINIPVAAKRWKFEDVDGVEYGYLLEDLSIVGVSFIQYAETSINDSDSIIWNVKVGNHATSHLVKNSQGYSRADKYIGMWCIIWFSRATDSNLAAMNSILDTATVRYRKKE